MKSKKPIDEKNLPPGKYFVMYIFILSCTKMENKGETGVKRKTENKRDIKMIVFLICLGPFLLAAFMRLLLPFFLFMPSSRMEQSPADINLPFQELMLTTQDSIELHCWFIPAPKARGTLLFFHGNAGNISHRLDSIRIFNELGMSVFIVSYRGYGQSQGRPSIKGLNQDALAAWHWLTELRGISPEAILVFGRSLGGAVAMELMNSVRPGALILDSTFSSVADMSPFPAPVASLILGGDFWNSEKTARNLNIPAMVIHSPQDEVIPFSQGQRIYQALGADIGGNEGAGKTFLEIRGRHNTGFMESLADYTVALDRFLTQYFGEYVR